MESINHDVPQVAIVVVDITKGEPVSNVLVKLMKEGYQMPDESLTDDQGAAVFPVKTLGTHTIVLSKTDFISY